MRDGPCAVPWHGRAKGKADFVQRFSPMALDRMAPDMSQRRGHSSDFGVRLKLEMMLPKRSGL
jgi:hypothetical protein